MSVKTYAQFHHCHWSRGQYCDVISGGCPGTAIGTDTPGEIRPMWKNRAVGLAGQGMTQRFIAVFTRAVVKLINVTHILILLLFKRQSSLYL
jgi:hypothetical protein